MNERLISIAGENHLEQNEQNERRKSLIVGGEEKETKFKQISEARLFEEEAEFRVWGSVPVKIPRFEQKWMI